EATLVQKIGEMTVLEEMAELAISDVYPTILVDEKVDAIGRPEVKINKLAAGNPLEFTIVTAVVPVLDLPDYKKIAADEIKKLPDEYEKITDKELDDAVLRTRKSRVSHDGHDHEKMSDEEHEKMIMDNLPELTDDFVKELGDFSDVPDFKNKLSSMLAEDKKNLAKEKRRIAIADAISDKVKAELPDVMIESELNRNEAQFKADIERMGLKIEDYLSHAKKTIEDLRTEWRPHAEKKAKLQLILNAIAEKEKIRPTPEEINDEVNHIVEHYKDADRLRAEIYADTVLTNEKVFQFLEK
ncbi:MAG: trigger factor, partial [Candidatus Pacebacteria bacterium]|nr:trigger factor [Candidatus Paceibacterota bacterium]